MASCAPLLQHLSFNCNTTFTPRTRESVNSDHPCHHESFKLHERERPHGSFDSSRKPATVLFLSILAGTVVCIPSQCEVPAVTVFLFRCVCRCCRFEFNVRSPSIPRRDNVRDQVCDNFPLRSIYVEYVRRKLVSVTSREYNLSHRALTPAAPTGCSDVQYLACCHSLSAKDVGLFKIGNYTTKSPSFCNKVCTPLLARTLHYLSFQRDS